MAIDYNITAYPTVYKDRLYRSRLEAKWAAFFDLCGWGVEYEPFDLGEWSPDFLIAGHRAEILVEVKPITQVDVPTIYKMHTAAERAGFRGDLLLVGTGVRDSRSLGWLCSNEAPTLPMRSNERGPYPDEMKIVPWFVPAMTMQNPSPDISAFYCTGTRSGVEGCVGLIYRRPLPAECEVDGGHYNFKPLPETTFSLLPLWAKACNAVQWHRK
jgi:hypothetical protein